MWFRKGGFVLLLWFIVTRMNQEERDNGIGRLVRRYNDNEEALAILKDKIGQLPAIFIGLGKWLEQPDDLVAHKKGDSTVVERGQQSIEFDINELCDLLNEYRKILDEKEKMEDRLRQANLSNIIR